MKPQNTHRRPYLRWTAIALICLMSPFFALAAAVAVTGTVTVEVDEKSADGTHLYIPVPALVFDLALLAAPLIIPDEALAEVRREIAPYRQGLRQMADSLESMPSGVLVEVLSDGEQVRISKQGRTFHIRVQSEDTDVSIAVPARLLGSSLDVI